ncbi:MAG TPA: caspase family protein [Fimbriiglobus sp.]|nr:caspase family protein [Fimbriiglobus sp.]
MTERPRRLLITAAVLACLAGAASAEDAVQHPGRREQSTPGLVLETGARTAACDVLTFTADGKSLLAAGDDKVVRSWAVSADGRLGPSDLPTLRWPIFREMRGNIYTAALTADQRRIVVAGHGQLSGGFAAAVIDRATGALLHGTGNPGEQQQGTVWASAFSPSGNRVALGTVTGAVWVWDLTTERLTQVGQHNPPKGRDPWTGTVRLVAFDGEDRVLSVGGNELRAWRVGQPDRNELLQTFGGPITVPAALSPDGKWVGAIPERPGQKQFTVELVSVSDARHKRTLTLDLTEVPFRLAFSRSGRYLAVAFRRVGQPDLDPTVTFYQVRGGRVLIYDLTAPDGTPPAAGPEQGLYAEGLAFHPTNEHWLAVAGGDNHEVILWDWKTSKKIGEVDQPGCCLWGVALSPDGDRVSFQETRLHKAPHPNQRGTGPWRTFDLIGRRFVDGSPPAPRPNGDSPDGWKVLTTTADSRQADAWSVESPNGKRFPLPWSRTEDEFPRCYAFLPGGRLVVGHYWGASVYDLTPDGPRRVRVLRGHDGYVIAMAASRDGKRLVTASRDMTLAGWSLEDWPYHPRLGAELFERDGKLLVGRVAPGSPLWEMGLSPGDAVEALLVADHTLPGQAKARLVFDRRLGERPAGTPAAAVEFLRSESRPGVEHLFFWRTPGDPKLYKGLTTVIDRPLWKFFPHGERDWVMWRWRDYYYDCSINGDFRIGWQRSQPLQKLKTPDFYRAEQFRGEFLKPEKLATTLRTWRAEPDLVRLNEIEPPAVAVGEPKPVAGGYEVSVTASAQGSLANQKPDRVLVWLNDYLLADWRVAVKDEGGGMKDEQKSGSDSSFIPPPSSFKVTVPADKLRGGENFVVAQCYSRGGARADASPRTIRRDAAPAGRTLYALLVGVSDYSRARPRQTRLRSAEDARVLGDALKAQKGRGPFAAVHVKLLPDEEATRTAILTELDTYRNRVKPDDLLVFHLGGHGTSLAELRQKKLPARKLAGLGRFLFMCGDFDLDRMPDTTVGFEDLHDRLSRLPCHKLILLDACHSGEARTAGGDTDANPVRILTHHGIGCTILAACGPDEEAIENDALDPIGGGHGLFTIALRRLLESGPVFAGADGNGDNRLDAAELAAGVAVQVKELVAEHNALLRRLGEKAGDRQDPVAFVPQLEKTTPVAAKVPGPGSE